MRKSLIFLSLLALTACFGPSAKKLQQENDSLVTAAIEKDRQMNEFAGALLEIDENVQRIKEKESIITTNVSSGEYVDPSIRTRINSDIQAIYDLMLMNKEKISELEKHLKASDRKNENLNKLVGRLNKQLKEKTLEIIQLNELLAQKNIEIADLNFTIDGLQSAIDSLRSTSQIVTRKLEESTEMLNEAYYVFGTRKELKEQKIISKEGLPLIGQQKVLSEGFDTDYFTRIDIREVDSIPLFRTKGKVLTNHPEGSYAMDKTDEGTLVLTITDKEKFWSISKFLVVQVN